jgi:hypothetical protein
MTLGIELIMMGRLTSMMVSSALVYKVREAKPPPVNHRLFTTLKNAAILKYQKTAPSNPRRIMATRGHLMTGCNSKCIFDETFGCIFQGDTQGW